ncbi:MarR family transcriptional regulator [Streptomyces albidoflavus]|uniref:MarR family winged helix-turn-helix transcriptional regulator n=1 Tax=Streptomyces albidoflavus TaxID=1886 RepID=UPI0033ABA7A4
MHDRGGGPGEGRHGDHRAGRRRRDALERSAYILLSRLEVQGPMSIGELCDAFGLDASTLNRQTAAVLRAGPAERVPGPEGGMARRFRMTEAGVEALWEEREGVVGSLERVMADWPEEGIAAFAACLRRFDTGIERLGGRPWPRP